MKTPKEIRHKIEITEGWLEYAKERPTPVPADIMLYEREIDLLY